MRLRLLVFVALGASCTRSPEPAAGSASPPASRAGGVSAPLLSPAASASPEPPALSITNLGPGEFELESKQPVRLAKLASIERRTPDGSFADIPYLDVGRGYRLVEQCESPLPQGPPAPSECIDLGASSVFRPVPWHGFNCAAQCNGNCRASSFEGPGTFRLVVRACDGGKVTGPSFELPEREHARSLWRWGIGTQMLRASVARLEGPTGGWDAKTPPSPDRIAGFVVRAHTEHAVDSGGLTELRDLLQSAKGFDDQIEKRCSMKHLVGLRVIRQPVTTGTVQHDTVELALDFNCQKLFAVRGGDRGRARDVQATHFDASRAAFLSWVRRFLPDDAELAKLK